MHPQAVFPLADVWFEWFECMPASQTIHGHNDGFETTTTTTTEEWVRKHHKWLAKALHLAKEKALHSQLD